MNVDVQVFGLMFSFLLGEFLRVEIIGHRVSVYLITWEISKTFSKCGIIVHSLGLPIALYHCQQLVLPAFLILAILTGIEYLIVVWFFIPLPANNLIIFYVLIGHFRPFFVKCLLETFVCFIELLITGLHVLFIYIYMYMYIYI